MATLANIRIYTQSMALPQMKLRVAEVFIENNTIVATSTAGGRFTLGVIPMENIVVETPSASIEHGCATTNANVFATVIKAVDGITPDMSDYYNKVEVEERLRSKQGIILDLATIRGNAYKGATALQSVPSEYVTESELQSKGYATTEQVDAKQNEISDLEAIRAGAAKGATALQTESYRGTVTGVKANNTTYSPKDGVVDIGTVITSHQDISGKQDVLKSGENIKTINGNNILGSGDITIEGVDNVYIADFTLTDMTATTDKTIDFASLHRAMMEGKVILVNSGIESYIVATTRYIPGIGRDPNKIYISVTDGTTIYKSTAISNPASIKGSENTKSTIATTDYVDNKSSDVYVMDIKLSALSNDQDVTFDYASLENAINEGKIILIEDPFGPKGMFMVSASLQGDSIVLKVNNTLSYIWAAAYSNGDGTGTIRASDKMYKSYATEEYVTNVVGDINTLLETIIAG